MDGEGYQLSHFHFLLISCLFHRQEPATFKGYLRRLATLHLTTYGNFKLSFIFFLLYDCFGKQPSSCLEVTLLAIDQLSIKLELYIIKECRLKKKKSCAWKGRRVLTNSQRHSLRLRAGSRGAKTEGGTMKNNNRETGKVNRKKLTKLFSSQSMRHHVLLNGTFFFQTCQFPLN